MVWWFWWQWGDSDIVARGSDGNDNCGCFSGGNSNDNNYDCGSSNGNVKSNSGTMRKIILLEFIIDTFFMKFETPGFGYGWKPFNLKFYRILKLLFCWHKKIINFEKHKMTILKRKSCIKISHPNTPYDGKTKAGTMTGTNYE